MVGDFLFFHWLMCWLVCEVQVRRSEADCPRALNEKNKFDPRICVDL
jgi:hypothetical protein